MEQLSTPYTDPERQNARRQTDGQTDRWTDEGMMPIADGDWLKITQSAFSYLCLSYYLFTTDRQMDSALEVFLKRYALYKFTFYLLFTLHYTRIGFGLLHGLSFRFYQDRFTGSL